MQSSQPIIEKWSQLCSSPIERPQATAIISELYQSVGYPAPKIVFVDSPWATSIAAEVVSRWSSKALHSIDDNIQHLFKRIYAQLLRQLVRQFDTEEDCTRFAAQVSSTAATKIHYCQAKDFWMYDAALNTWYGYPRTQLDQLSSLAIAFYGFGHRSLGHPWRDEMIPNRGADIDDDWLAQLLTHLYQRLHQQIGGQIDQFPEVDYSFPDSKPLWCSLVTDAAVFEQAASVGHQFDPQLLTLFLTTAQHLGFINPFEEICFVSDRPRYQRDAQNYLHGSGEPAVVFPDSFGMNYFYHGTQLPQYIGRVHPSRWQPQWLLWEENAEVRRCLVQEIGYGRICQELQAVNLDRW